MQEPSSTSAWHEAELQSTRGRRTTGEAMVVPARAAMRVMTESCMLDDDLDVKNWLSVGFEVRIDCIDVGAELRLWTRRRSWIVRSGT